MTEKIVTVERLESFVCQSGKDSEAAASLVGAKICRYRRHPEYQQIVKAFLSSAVSDLPSQEIHKVLKELHSIEQARKLALARENGTTEPSAAKAKAKAYRPSAATERGQFDEIKSYVDDYRQQTSSRKPKQSVDDDEKDGKEKTDKIADSPTTVASKPDKATTTLREATKQAVQARLVPNTYAGTASPVVPVALRATAQPLAPTRQQFKKGRDGRTIKVVKGSMDPDEDDVSAREKTRLMMERNQGA